MYSRKLDWPGICFLNGVGLVDSWCWISEMIENPVIESPIMRYCGSERFVGVREGFWGPSGGPPQLELLTGLHTP